MKTLLFLLLLLPVFAEGQIITTIAGGGTAGLGDGGLAISAELNLPSSVAIDAMGSIYFTDAGGNRIRKIDITTGIISTIAGIGTAGYSGDNSTATSAMLNGPQFLTIDTSGNIYFTDFGNNRVRRISVDNIITTYAGNGATGYNGDNILATTAAIGDPMGITIDKSGNLYFGDGNARVRKVSPLGIISTYAGNGSFGYSGDGGPATSAMLHYQHGIRMDNTGNLYIADMENYRVRKVNSSGIITTIAGNGFYSYSGTSGNGGPADSATIYPTDVMSDGLGNVYISDYGSSSIRKVNTLGIITAIAGNGTAGFSGDGGMATSAELYQPWGIAFDSCGNLHIADNVNNRIRKVAFNPACWPQAVQLVATAPTIVNIYPNPTTTSLTISSPDKITSIAITNLLGQTVYTNQYNAEQVEVDVSALPAGMYLVRINGSSAGSGQVEVRRFVKE